MPLDAYTFAEFKADLTAAGIDERAKVVRFLKQSRALVAARAADAKAARARADQQAAATAAEAAVQQATAERQAAEAEFAGL